MNPENASILGYVLLLVGIALAFIGYAIYLNLRGEKASGSAEVSETSEDPEEQDTENMIDDDKPGDLSSDELDSESFTRETPGYSDEGSIDTSSDELLEETSESIEIESLGPGEAEMKEDEPSIVVPDEPELIPAATLLREGVTGRIVIRVGERQYNDVEALRNSKDWSRVKSLSSDLRNWIEDKPMPSTPPQQREDIKIAPSPERQASVSDSMIMQINDIIDNKVKKMEGEEREIRLVEGELGVLEVRVGLEKFPIDDVPYSNVRDLIQDAVSQWEKSQ